MDIKEFQKIIPIDSRKKVTELTSFLSSCSLTDRLPIEFCVKFIEDVRLREVFFLKCLTQNIYPGKEGFIRNMQKAMFNAGGIVAPMVASLEYAKEVAAAAKAEDRKAKAAKKKRRNDEKKRRKELLELMRAKKKAAALAPKPYSIQTITEPISKNPKVKKNIDITPVDMESRVFAKVRAEELILQDGVILYHKYSLNTGRVKRVNKTILSKIDHTFHLIEDFTLSSKSKEPRFHFWPYNDLSFLLGEIERLQTTIPVVPSSDFPQSGRFQLPWKYVVFYDGIMYFEHPNTSKRGTLSPYHYRHSYILKSYRDILPYIESRCPLFEVEAKDGVINKVYNFTAFMNMIPSFYEKVKMSDDEIEVSNDAVSIGKTFTKFDFSSHIKRNKSPYISFLSKNQSENRLIYYLLESVNHISSETDHEEHGYLFTIKEFLEESTLIFENVTDESRSSIVFKVRSLYFVKAVEAIRRFLASDIKNKRQKLANCQIRLNDVSIIRIDRIIHNDFDSWQSQVNSLF